mmetsp:Transcript_23281/g.34173  ORF Transcript_23281/g.34173 Transcript_23281/m.34173 type:complete len:103 (+) Transcript_23281:224-532(+)
MSGRGCVPHSDQIAIRTTVDDKDLERLRNTVDDNSDGRLTIEKFVNKLISLCFIDIYGVESRRLFHRLAGPPYSMWNMNCAASIVSTLASQFVLCICCKPRI